MSKIIYPRPTVLITSCSLEGRPNIASFSFIMPVSLEPKYITFSISPLRYTFENLKEVKEFVVNVPSEDMLREIWICGTTSGKDADKFKLAGLEATPSFKVKPPRLRRCPVQLECRVEFMEEFGDHYLVVGRVVEEHVEKRSFKTIMHHSKNRFFKIGQAVEA